MEGKKIKKIKIKADVFSASSKGTNKKMYAEKGEKLTVNAERDGILYVKGKREVFPISVDAVEILEFEEKK